MVVLPNQLILVSAIIRLRRADLSIPSFDGAHLASIQFSILKSMPPSKMAGTSSNVPSKSFALPHSVQSRLDDYTVSLHFVLVFL